MSQRADRHPTPGPAPERKPAARSAGFLRELPVVAKVALLVAAIGSVLLALSCSPSSRPTSERRPPAASPRRTVAETTRSIEPTPTPPPRTYGLPVRLKIERLGIDAAIEQVGVGKDGAMQAPKGPLGAGWYKLGTKPGERGSAVIAGHSGYKDGREAIFDHLTKLVAGDRVVVVDETGVSIAFVVRESRLLDPAADATDVFARADGAYLNLVTCTGAWSEAAHTHTKRLVVFTDAVPPGQ